MFMIKYPNGTKDVITTNNETSPVIRSANTKTHGLAIVGFVSSILGLLVAGIILGALAVIFGGIGLGKINSQADKYKGKGLAIASIIIGVIDIIGALILIAILL